MHKHQNNTQQHNQYHRRPVVYQRKLDELDEATIELMMAYQVLRDNVTELKSNPVRGQLLRERYLIIASDITRLQRMEHQFCQVVRRTNQPGTWLHPLQAKKSTIATLYALMMSAKKEIQQKVSEMEGRYSAKRVEREVDTILLSFMSGVMLYLEDSPCRH